MSPYVRMTFWVSSALSIALSLHCVVTSTFAAVWGPGVSVRKGDTALLHVTSFFFFLFSLLFSPFSFFLSLFSFLFSPFSFLFPPASHLPASTPHPNPARAPRPRRLGFPRILRHEAGTPPHHWRVRWVALLLRRPGELHIFHPRRRAGERRAKQTGEQSRGGSEAEGGAKPRGGGLSRGGSGKASPEPGSP